ncbi:amidase signature enzyme [Bimuria novae-zelandiae CBS 107.79]|uniref:Amidase signature enzyme n=1 Tax=Bimuria novae-zelandiae CBS 107.79 TaxID=1447943 RepID=A0A6A5UK74_9PLEO|nr:amidase signature enzyme [Bimuria novae-zelandiae CBS 107.79]
MFKYLKQVLTPSAFEPELPPEFFQTIHVNAARKGSFVSSSNASTSLPEFDPLVASAFELAEMLNAGVITSVEIVEAYLHQIEQHNRRGRQLQALISVAPRHELVRIARRLDDERSRGKRRGPLHGIPIVLKDNIMTEAGLGMDTTVGSYAFVGCTPKRNATIVDRLIRRGLIILGKANLTEFCGLKNPSMPPGWSAVGGQTQSPYVARHIAKKKLHWELSAPGGSSTGSAVSVAAGFSALAIGTDTLGSMITPANRAALYALKPTIGEVPMDGIFTLSKSFDSTGGMAKSAKDLVALMDVLLSPSGKDPSFRQRSGSAFKIRTDFTGLRIGFTEPTIWRSWRKSARINADAERFMLQKYDMVVQSLIEMGVDIVYPVPLPSQSSLNHPSQPDQNSFEPLVYAEFKECLAEFVRQFRWTKVHSLAEIINFNKEHEELTLPAACPHQSDLLAALQSHTSKETLRSLREHLANAGGRSGLDAVFAAHELDILIAPGDSALCTIAAAASYPTAACPLSALKLNGQPFGLTLTSPPHTDARLLHFLTAYEATFPPRAIPLPLSSVPLQVSAVDELGVDKGIEAVILREWDARRWGCSADALTAWLNRRWKKSGYEVDPETVCEVLRRNGRMAVRGLGEEGFDGKGSSFGSSSNGSSW